MKNKKCRKNENFCENSLTGDPDPATTLSVHQCPLCTDCPGHSRLPNNAHLGFTWRGKYFFRMWQIISAERGPHPHSAALRDCPMQIFVGFFNFFIDTVQCTQYLHLLVAFNHFYTLRVYLEIFSKWPINWMSLHQFWDACSQPSKHRFVWFVIKWSAKWESFQWGRCTRSILSEHLA